tara:strand:- start:248 stop:892 length:645 start_codon:yes stop_codon:yes gene_type:complete
MLRIILIILVTLFFGIPFLYEQSLATETKIIEMNGQEWLVTYEPGKEPMLRPLEKTEPKVVLSSSVKEEPEWQRRTVKESKIVQTCNDPMGCEMTVEGDCPDCKTELVKEETVEIVQKTDFTEFKSGVRTKQKLNSMKVELPHYLSSYVYLRDIGHPEWICWKVRSICNNGDPISIEDLFAGQQNASYCTSIGFDDFNFSNPVDSCQNSTILNL